MKNRPPLLSDTSSDLLDHLELSAIIDADHNASASELLTDLTIPGSQDAADEDEELTETPEERIAGVIDAVFTEAELRVRACGERNYPFKLEGRVLLNEDQETVRVYTFLLILSLFGEETVRGVNGTKLFEEVCAFAAASYFGCPDKEAESYVFGFPRRIGPKDFPGAVENLCVNMLCEGQADKKFPGAKEMKDASLDIVTWRPFPDGRSSKFILFGQCATGLKQHWWGKRHELQPIDWCRTWLLKSPLVIPAKAFFVPHVLDDTELVHLSYQAGIVFDRFRISHFAENSITPELRVKLGNWSRGALAD